MRLVSRPRHRSATIDPTIRHMTRIITSKLLRPLDTHVLQEEAAGAGAAATTTGGSGLATQTADDHERPASEGHIISAVAASDANIVNEAGSGVGRESGGASSAAAITRTAPPSVTWRSGYASTAEAMATSLLVVSPTAARIPGKTNPAVTAYEPPYIPYSSKRRNTTAPPGKPQSCNKGIVASRRAPISSSDKSRWRRRDCDTAFTPRLQTIAEYDPKLPSARALTTIDGISGVPLLGAEKRHWVGSGKDEEELEEEDGKEEEGEGVYDEAEKTEVEANGKGKELEDVKHEKEQEYMETERASLKGKEKEEKEGVEDAEEKREKAGIKEKDGEGGDEEEMEEERKEVRVKGERLGGDKKVEEEEETEGKEEEVIEEKETMEQGQPETMEQGQREAKEQGKVEEGEGVGVEKEESEEGSQTQAQQQEEQKENVVTGVGLRVSPIVAESSMVINGVSEAASVNSAVTPLGAREERGSLVPAEFRPSERKDDVLCTWNLSMVRPKTDAATLGEGAFGASFVLFVVASFILYVCFLPGTSSNSEY